MLYKINVDNEYDSSKLLFSIPIHEKQDVINNQIENILNNCPNSKIIIHVNKSFKNFDKNLTEYENVYINSRQFNYVYAKGLLWIHINNFEEAIDLNIDFKYFIIMSSNEMLIRKGLNMYIEHNKNGAQIVEFSENVGWHNFRKGIERDSNVLKLLEDLKLNTIYGGQTEGQFYEKNIFKMIADKYKNFFGNNELQNFETEEILCQTIFKSLDIPYVLPFTLQNYCNKIVFTEYFINNIINNTIIIPDNSIKDNLFSPHIKNSCESIYSIKRVDRTFNPTRLFLSQKGFILNKDKYQLNTNYYSNGSILRLLDENYISFKQKLGGQYHWFGYEIDNGYYYLNFHLKLNVEFKQNLINKNIGLKIHYPNEIIYSYFLDNIEINIWKNIRIPIYIKNKQLIIFIFDDYNNELDLEIKNIQFLSYSDTINSECKNNEKENIILNLYENPNNKNGLLNTEYSINYLNITRMIIEPLTKLYNIYIICSIYNVSKINQICNFYKPFDLIVLDKKDIINNIYINSNKVIDSFISLYNIPIKLVVYFSLDSIFKRNITDFNFFINKFNFISYHIPYIDNKISNSYDFMTIPYKYLNYFTKLMEDNLMNSTICYNIYYELKNQVGINNFHFIYDDNYTNNDRTPLIKYLNDIREINNNNGYLFNKKYLYHIYYYNNESKILKNERDEYYFYKKNTHKYIPYQWIGIYLDYIFTNNILNKNNQQLIDINIEFSIKLLKNINNNDKENYGIKTHEPLKYYNKWFEECIYNEFTNIKLLIKILPKSQYIILNFDEYFEEIEFYIKDFKVIT
jgi:hypothetical protein